MTYLIRFILVGIIIYLLVRSFTRYFAEQEEEARKRASEGSKEPGPKGVSKEIGEYIDYEEVKDE
jgi:large-conductance mechanosensitive channel